MAVILNIETSNTACSVALTAEGMVLHHLENMHGRNHAVTLSDFIKSMLDFARDKEIRLDAVSVSLGPGSYTGLRIGLSEAKGLAYGMDIPLIGIQTLELMATRVMFSTDAIDPDTVFVPMIDARRMEVYTAAYDFGLTPLIEPRALILDESGNPYHELIETGRPILFFGNGMPKWKEYFLNGITDAVKERPDGGLTFNNVTFVEGVEPLAVDMIALAERAYTNRQFIDVAYSVPTYLKDFQATTPRNPIVPTT